jgi:hypothetical protein
MSLVQKPLKEIANNNISLLSYLKPYKKYLDLSGHYLELSFLFISTILFLAFKVYSDFEYKKIKYDLLKKSESNKLMDYEEKNINQILNDNDKTLRLRFLTVLKITLIFLNILFPIICHYQNIFLIGVSSFFYLSYFILFFTYNYMGRVNFEDSQKGFPPSFDHEDRCYVPTQCSIIRVAVLRNLIFETTYELLQLLTVSKLLRITLRRVKDPLLLSCLIPSIYNLFLWMLFDYLSKNQDCITILDDFQFVTKRDFMTFRWSFPLIITTIIFTLTYYSSPEKNSEVTSSEVLNSFYENTLKRGIKICFKDNLYLFFLCFSMLIISILIDLSLKKITEYLSKQSGNATSSISSEKELKSAASKSKSNMFKIFAFILNICIIWLLYYFEYPQSYYLPIGSLLILILKSFFLTNFLTLEITQKANKYAYWKNLQNCRNNSVCFFSGSLSESIFLTFERQGAGPSLMFNLIEFIKYIVTYFIDSYDPISTHFKTNEELIKRIVIGSSVVLTILELSLLSYAFYLIRKKKDEKNNSA